MVAVEELPKLGGREKGRGKGKQLSLLVDSVPCQCERVPSDPYSTWIRLLRFVPVEVDFWFRRRQVKTWVMAWGCDEEGGQPVFLVSLDLRMS